MPVTLLIEPREGLADMSRRIAVQGLAPGERIEIGVTTRGNDGAIWSAHPVFLADAQGSVDLARDAPLQGAYEGVDVDGFFWSQTQTGQAPAPVPAGSQQVCPISVEINVSSSAGVLARDAFEQAFLAPGVTRTHLDQDGFVGTLFVPGSPGPHPAVVVLYGSGGGINEQRAALLASHGFAALALGYFGAPGLPAHISGTPLEYFERALQWLHKEVRPLAGYVAVMGQSRGGELSLLLGSEYPELVSAVVAYVPSAVIHGVLAAGYPGENRFAPAWTRAGKALVTVWADNEVPDAWAAIDRQAEPRRQSTAFVAAQQNPDAVARARIPVDNIRGPVLLISGGDDGYWPSTDYARDVAQQLRNHRHPHEVLHLDYPGAGHFIQHPLVPTTVIARAHPVSRIVMTGGGTPEANARANRDSWPQCLDFLSRSVAALRNRLGPP